MNGQPAPILNPTPAPAAGGNIAPGGATAGAMAGVLGAPLGSVAGGDRWPLSKVLVADPDPILLDLYRFLLTGVASQVIGVEDGIEALRAFVRERPNLVVLGADLPRVGAEEVLRRLKSNAAARKVPVVMVRSGGGRPAGRDGAAGPSDSTPRLDDPRGSRPAARPDATLFKPFDATQFYETVARLGRLTGVAPSSGGSLLLRRQHHFEGYQLQQLIRSEPWSSTYLAYQQSLRRPVVMKVLSLQGAARPEIVEEFRGRVRQLASISHPGLARVIESGHNDATHFATTQYVGGPALSDLVLLRALDLAEIHAIADRLFSTLARLHRGGIVLGTIRPDTLIIDQHGSLRLVDFAAVVSEQGVSDPGASGSWGPLETLERIAVEGGREAASKERDACRALAILYWLLTGELPRLKPPPPSMYGRRLARPLDDLFVQALSGRDAALLGDTPALHVAVTDGLVRSMRARERQRMGTSRAHPLGRLLADAVVGRSPASDQPAFGGDSYA